MNILIAASEAVPFCKTGGLADVVGALTQVLGRMGHRVCLFLPSYRAVEGGGHSLKAVAGKFWIPVGEDLVQATLLSASWGAATVYFIQCPKYFSRDGLYQESDKDYPDNDERFIFFSRAVLECAKFIGFKPDVIHCHDWQTALIPAYLRTLYHIDAYYARVGTVLTIHNIAYQGMFTKDTMFTARFGWADFTPERLEYYGGFNFLKAGLVFADALSTVSPTYAREIQASPEFGRGLEGLLRHRSQDFVGILNGIDTDVWDPENDPFLTTNYGAENALENKAINKAALRQECALASSERVPLIGIVSRLDPQKGLDMALQVLTSTAAHGVQLVVLGTGDSGLQQAYARLAENHPRSVHFHAAFDEAFSHRIYASADIFLMPSRFEPCGLGQMIAMRYGAVPVVTHTGGLADTVRETESGGRPNGFVAPNCTREDLREALERALKAHARPQDWSALVANAMSEDFSWKHSAQRYVKLYEQVISKLS